MLRPPATCLLAQPLQVAAIAAVGMEQGACVCTVGAIPCSSHPPTAFPCPFLPSSSPDRHIHRSTVVPGVVHDRISALVAAGGREAGTASRVLAGTIVEGCMLSVKQVLDAVQCSILSHTHVKAIPL